MLKKADEIIFNAEEFSHEEAWEYGKKLAAYVEDLEKDLEYCDEQIAPIILDLIEQTLARITMIRALHLDGVIVDFGNN